MRTSRITGWALALALGASSGVVLADDTPNATGDQSGAPSATPSQSATSSSSATSPNGSSHTTNQQGSSGGGNRQSATGRQSLRDMSASAPADQVKALQRRLKQQNLYSGDIDGVMGKQTQVALREYQRQQGLHVTGRLDQATATALGMKTGAYQAVSGREMTSRNANEKTIELTSLDMGQVKMLQRHLKEMGFYAANIDGSWGRNTRDALERYFQHQAMLVSQGKADPQSLNAFGIESAPTAAATPSNTTKSNSNTNTNSGRVTPASGSSTGMTGQGSQGTSK